MHIAIFIILAVLLLLFLSWTLPQLCPSLLLVFRQWDRYRFTAKAEVVGQVQNMQDVDTFEVSILGRIVCRTNRCDTDVQVEVIDTTEMLHPLKILCVDTQMQKNTSGEFFYKAPYDIIPGRNVILAKWRTVMKITLETLRFPHRGQRRLLFTIRLCDRLTGRKVVEAQTVLNYFVSIREGYLDFQQRQEKVLAAGWILARQTAGQTTLPAQEQLLTQWFDKVKGNKVTFETFSPQQYVGDSPMDVLHKAGAVLAAQSDAAFRYDLMSLCLQIAEADKPVKHVTQDWLRAVGAMLEITPERFHEMYQKAVPLDAQENPDPAFILGIDETLSPEQLAERLTEEYQKWNSRVNHPDPNVRKRADEMLSYLTAIRNRTPAQTA
jgi:hypothetical protein